MSIYLGTNEVSTAGTNGGYMLNGRLITTKTYSFNLGQTDFAEKTPTTSTQTLKLPTTTYTTTASTSATFFRLGEDYDGTIIDRNAHDYVVFHTYLINFNYGSNNVSGTIHGIRSGGTKDCHAGKYHISINSTTGISTDTLSKNSTYTTSTSPFLYQKADNTYGITTSQGLYASPTIATFGSSDNKDYLSLQFSTLYVKYNDSYCPLVSLQALNPANTIITLTWEVYEGDKSMYSAIYDTAYNLVTNH